jgi:glycosyltransferase involved in cell wall biosynthesis
MKIGIDCRLYQETGVGRYVRNLIKNLQVLDKKNKYVLFVLSKDRDEILKQVDNENFRIVKADIKWHTLSEQLRFPQILNKENLDLMHFPYFSVPVYYRRPFVVTIHDLIVDHFSTGKASTLPSYIYSLKLYSYKFVLKQAAKNAKKIIAVSQATKNEIIDHLKINEHKIEVTYEGVDRQIANSLVPDKLQNKKYFLYVGNAYPHKNLNRLLQAYKTLKQNVYLVLVVKKDYFYERLKRKANDLNLSERVIFLHDIKDGELSGLYRKAIALVFPSLMEGFGLPVLEAMANNCLVLASDIPSLKEICLDSAIYFNPHDIQDIAEKMNEACLGGYSGKKENALERSKSFSFEKMAKETIKIYESCFSL